MNMNETIASGILEAYAIGCATPEEVRLVEANLHDHEVKKELTEIEDALQALAFKLERPVPASVKMNLDQLLFAEESSPIIKEEPKVISLQERKASGGALRFLSIAASIALVVSLGLNFIQYANYKEVKDQMAQMEATNSVLAGEVRVVKQDLDFYGTISDFFQRGDIKVVKLAAAPTRDGNSAMVYYDAESGKVAIKADGLAAIDNQHQYQLWALVDGKPVDLGMIPNDSVGKEQLAMLKSVKGMQAFAITKEIYGGKPTPNLEELMVIGNV